MHPLGQLRGALSFMTLSCFLAVSLVSTNDAVAAVPAEINFQGLLLDSGGGVVDGLVDLDFEFFDAASAGTSLWSESQPDVPVLQGVYNVALGSISPIGAAVLVGGSVWLEITVEGETLTPRQPLLAVAFALRSAEADHAASADTATSADFASSVDSATTADTVGNLPSGVLAALYADFPFDGADPPNDDPSEGLADTDGDGIANFTDSDNDNDGIPDALELGNNSDINLVTPTITGALPSVADDIFPTPVTVTGSGFIAGQTIAVGPQTPTPMNITPTSFDIVLDAQPAPASTNIIVTRPNAELASLPFGFDLTLPSVSSIMPPIVGLSEAVTVDVVGSEFLGAFTVTLDGNPVTPINVTPTSFSIDVVAPAFAASLPIVVTLSNGQSVSQSLSVQDVNMVFITSSKYAGDLGGISGGDALCASHAASAGLSGTFLAWLGDSSGGPTDNFTPSILPYFRVDGAIVANDFADLADGDIQAPIFIDEFGNPVTQSGVWTSVTTIPNVFPRHCDDWSSAATGASGYKGLALSVNLNWTHFSHISCNVPLRLYCFEQ